MRKNLKKARQKAGMTQKKKQTASGGKQPVKDLEYRQFLDRQESLRQYHFEGISDKAELQLYASVGAVLEKSAERTPLP